MFRFFVTPQDICDNSIKLSDDDSKHIRTLRLRPDEQFIVCDGNGTDYICQLGERDDCSTAEIISSHRSHGEPTVKCRVFIAYSKGDRLDYAVQKSVELGAYEILLFESERCIAVPRDIPKKVARLQRISLETAKQCNRGIIPIVSSVGNLDTAANEAKVNSELTVFFFESEDCLHIKEFLDKYFPPFVGYDEHKIKSISVITGPEGGFNPNEVESVRSMGIPIVSLGPRVLRSETAPVAALTAIMYQTGNMRI